MINTKPTEIVKDLFQALQKPDDVFIDQAVFTEAGSYLTYQELDPIFKTLLLGKLYCYFLYPSYCLCDYYKKKCECRKKRNDALQSCALKTYQMVLESHSENQKIDLNDPDVKATLHHLTSKLKLTDQQALQTLEYQYKKESDAQLHQAQLLTNIKDQADYELQQEALNPQAHQWFEQVISLTHDLKSYFSMAVGVGRHLGSQIDHLKQLTSGFKVHLSLTQVVNEVLEGKSLEFFNGIKFPKTKLIHALYMYRSILHLILGHTITRTRLHGENVLDLSTTTFTLAYDLQIDFLKYSKKALTPKENKSLFTENNLALVPDPSFFMPSQRFTAENETPKAMYPLNHHTTSDQMCLSYN